MFALRFASRATCALKASSAASIAAGRVARFSASSRTRAIADWNADKAHPKYPQLAEGIDLDRKVTVTLPETSFKTYQLESAPPSEVEVTVGELLDLYGTMVTTRRLEMASDSLYKAKMIRGFCHLCTGQEAIPVGMEAAITREDAIITAYRCHGFTYTRGGSVTSILAELLGRKDGCSKGKGGSMHLFANEFYGGNGIVGAQVPVGAGIAFTQNYLGKKACTFSLYGDGAANQGQVFEAYNIAKLWKLPAVFICENNRYGMGTSATRAAANTLYYTRGQYIPGIQVNGMDALAVKSAVAFARNWCIEGNGPMVMEMVTYRYGGHSMSDPGTTYRTREEIQNMRSTNDPITGLKGRIVDESLGNVPESVLKAIDKAARAYVDDCVLQAKASPEPAEGELWTNVYAKESPELIRGREPQEVWYRH